MATPTEKWTVGSELVDGSSHHVISTEMNSLASGALVPASVINTDGHFSNVSGDTAGEGAPEFRLHLHLAALVGNPAANSAVDGWILDAADGTTYESGSASITPARVTDFSFSLDSTRATAQDIDQVIQAPIGANLKLLVRNNGLGEALAASGNYIALYPTRSTFPSV